MKLSNRDRKRTRPTVVTLPVFCVNMHSKVQVLHAPTSEYVHRSHCCLANLARSALYPPLSLRRSVAQWIGSLMGIIMASVLLCVFNKCCYTSAAIVFAIGGIFLCYRDDYVVGQGVRHSLSPMLFARLLLPLRSF